MLVKFEQNRMIRTTENFEVFFTKDGLPFLTNR